VRVNDVIHFLAVCRHNHTICDPDLEDTLVHPDDEREASEQTKRFSGEAR